MRWAIIIDGLVHAIEEWAERPIHADWITVLPAPEAVREGWRYDVETDTWQAPASTSAPTVPPALAPASPSHDLQQLEQQLRNTAVQDLKRRLDDYLAQPSESALIEVMRQWRQTIP